MFAIAIVTWSLILIGAVAFYLSQRHIRLVVEPQLAAYNAARAAARADFAARGIDYDRATAAVDTMIARKLYGRA